MQRLLMNNLVAWKSGPRTVNPCCFAGRAKRGKPGSWQTFAKQEFRDFVKIDFMYDHVCPPPSSRARNLRPQAYSFDKFELRSGRTIDPENTLVVFDEIQEAPRGLTSLKYFCEQAREYHIIAAGSYMGMAMRREGESFPVGKVDQLTLRPLCFSEFVPRNVRQPPRRCARKRRHG